VTDLTQLPEMLTAVRGRGTASVAVIERAGAEPQAYWVPESDLEPAFLVYSITKTFTAALILKLSEEGQLSLDDRLARWFPCIAHADRISLRRLLNHTGGIPDYGGLRAYHEDLRSSPSAPWSFERFAAETFDKGLWFEPGQGWAYSNPGYMLLKRVAEKRPASPIELSFRSASLDHLDCGELSSLSRSRISPRLLRAHRPRFHRTARRVTCARTTILAGSRTASLRPLLPSWFASSTVSFGVSCYRGILSPR
jgi:Beta-lactamase